MFFRKPYKISLHLVNDYPTFQNGDKVITMHVQGKAQGFIFALMFANGFMKSVSKESTEQKVKNAAMLYAAAIFGKEQAEKLMDLCDGETAGLVQACNKYFNKRLKYLIRNELKQQKKEGVRHA